VTGQLCTGDGGLACRVLCLGDARLARVPLAFGQVAGGASHCRTSHQVDATETRVCRAEKLGQGVRGASLLDAVLRGHNGFDRAVQVTLVDVCHGLPVSLIVGVQAKLCSGQLRIN